MHGIESDCLKIVGMELCGICKGVDVLMDYITILVGDLNWELGKMIDVFGIFD